MFSSIFNKSNSKLFKYFRTEAYSTSINSILQNSNIGDKINIKGWIKALRKQKENIFIDISDGSTSQKLQVVISQSLAPKNISTGASISALGVIQTTPKGQLELSAQDIKVYNDCIVSNGYPFAPRKLYSAEYIRQHLHFRPRTNKFGSLLRIRSNAHLFFHNYLTSQGYVNVQTPILTSNDCEGAGEVFRVIPERHSLVKSMIKEGQTLEEAFFNTKTFLTVSGQLHLEAVAHGLTKVYTLGPTFRAENSRSRLHLAEFYMLEAEVAFLETLEDLMLKIEKLIKEVTNMIVNSNEEDINNCKSENKINFDWMDKKFVILTYKEAEDILKNSQGMFQTSFQTKNGISKEHELFLVKHCGNIPTFLINWPKITKPFYMKECPEDNSNVLALDLLVPEVGEIAGGSLRENNLNKLMERLPKDLNNLDWYLNLRKFGGVPTGGYGLGFERYLLFLTGISNIKDVIPFPRWPHNCSM